MKESADTEPELPFLGRFKQHYKDQKSHNFPFVLGLVLISAFLVSASLAPTISKNLGKLSQKKQGQEAHADIGGFLSMINNLRASNGLSPLVEDYNLMRAACWKANDMATHNYYAHTDSLGRNIRTMLQEQFNIGNEWVGENLDAASATADVSFQKWRDSPGHYANMVSSNFTRIGIGNAYNAGSDFQMYWATEFASNNDSSHPQDLANGRQDCSASYPLSNPQKGDVNCDGNIDSVDALLILRYVAALTQLSDTCQTGMVYGPSADVNSNSVIDAVDALFVLQYVAGIRSIQTLSLIPPATDTDGDGMTNGQEAQYSCLNPNIADATANPDNDSVSVVNQSLGVNININMNNAAELALGTNPCVADTDRDGFKDGVEVYVGTKPEKACITSDDDIDMTKPTHPSKTWPADLDTRGISYNKVNMPDLGSFVVSPKIYGTSPGSGSAYDIRWDLVPGTGAVPGSFINISDLDKVATGTAPMFGGQKMYGGPTCTP